MRVYDSMHECEACTRNLGLIVMEVPLSTAHIGSFHDCRRSRQSRVSVVIEQDWGILHCMHVQSCGGVPFVSFCILLYPFVHLEWVPGVQYGVFTASDSLRPR